MSDWVGPITVNCSGGAGSSTGSATSGTPVKGIIAGVLFNFHSSTAAASIVSTLATKGTLAPAYNLLVRTHSVSAGPFSPTFVSQDTTGANLTYDGTHTVVADMAVDDFVTLSIAGANNADQVDVYILLE